MDSNMLIKSLILLVFQILEFCLVPMASSQKLLPIAKNTYIVHTAKHKMPSSFDHHRSWYNSLLTSVSKSNEMLYIYEKVAHGFSASLTDSEARFMKKQPGVLSVFLDVKYNLHTTRTPHFLGLDKNSPLLPNPKVEGEVIVGLLDTGIWPESKSFDDSGMGPIPSRWKGECETGTNFSSSNCNKKLIGARSFYKAYEKAYGTIFEPEELRSPRDTVGHGTHTSSTAAGSVVPGANLFEYANGTARGMASYARISVYKVCWQQGCMTADILAAMDKAIDDNVDILSISLGARPVQFYYDIVSIGAFAAMEKGILVSCSAGNSGPDSGTITNGAPWIITVGASTLDRDFPAPVVLGNNASYHGVSLYKGEKLPIDKLPLIYGGNANTNYFGKFCTNKSLSSEKVKGKIVICHPGYTPRVDKGVVVKDAGGLGLIIANLESQGEELFADSHLLPATNVGNKFGSEIMHYAISDPNPTATIHFEGTKLNVKPAPTVARLSSRGPHLYARSIIKPDVIAPGLNILASWTDVRPPSGVSADKRRTEFNVMSGTSMSCPHVSGLAALLKAAHPEWTPAAIRSALVTTAYATYRNGELLQDSATGKASTPFDHGAGHVDPILALDPGLVYDLQAKDYLDYLCSLNYTPEQIKIITRSNFTCDATKKYNPNDLNYPSFFVAFEYIETNDDDTGKVVKYTRTLTNVGTPATYNVSVKLKSENVKVVVEPESLNFTKLGENKVYTVTFSTISKPTETYIFGRIEWSDGKHIVGSHIAITWK